MSLSLISGNSEPSYMQVANEFKLHNTSEPAAAEQESEQKAKSVMDLADDSMSGVATELLEMREDAIRSANSGALSENDSQEDGSQNNSLDFTIGYNTQTAYNLAAATNGTENTGAEKAVSEMDKQNILQTYRSIAQGKQQEEESQKLSIAYM